MKDVPKPVKKALQAWTKIIAMSVRNGMEDFHHKHLSDKQMKELNPIIRHHIYSALRDFWLFKFGNKDQSLIGAIDIHHNVSFIPDYWEDPDLTTKERSDEDKLLKMVEEKGLTYPSTKSSRDDFEEFRTKSIFLFG